MSNLSLKWTNDRLKDVADINVSALTADTDPIYEFDYLEISNVDYFGIIDPSAIETLRFENAPSRARRRVPKNSTLISSVRPNLQAVAFLSDVHSNLVCSTGFNVVQPNKTKLYPHFAYFYLISEYVRQCFEAAAKGVGYPAIDDKDFSTINIPLPPLPEQALIAAYLDASCTSIDAAVAAKRRQIETVAELKKASILLAVTQGLDQGVKKTDLQIPSYRPTPQHWKRSKLRYEISVQNGEFASDKLQDDGEYSVFGGNGIMGRTDYFNVDGETVVIGRVGAYCGNAHHVTGKAWISDNALIVKSRNYARFLCYLFNALNFNTQANNTAQPVITGTKIKNIYVVLPPRKEQEAICLFIEEKSAAFATICGNLEAQINTLLAYRKSLIHECVTGQRRVTEADLAKTEKKARNTWRPK